MSSREPVRDKSTEARLEAAALRLLERDGVLAGLNLREVAEEAEVSRGLVYHHFGSRRSLLRSALERSVRSRRSRLLRREKLPARRRLREFFEVSIADSTGIRLLTLLILDGDHSFSALPYAAQATEANTRDVEAGLLADDIELDAMQAGLLSAVYGYAIFRKSFAASLRRDPAELDEDVLRMFSRMWEPVGGPRSPET